MATFSVPPGRVMVPSLGLLNQGPLFSAGYLENEIVQTSEDIKVLPAFNTKPICCKD